jgi:L-rhamnose mutarotase
MKRFMTSDAARSLSEEMPMTSSAGPTRVCFTLQVKPEMLDEYLARHAPVRPEMLAEIAAAGRRNYSLFLGDGGRLIGYYETDDDDAAQSYLAASEVAARWEAEMAPFFVGLEGRPDQAATPLIEVFHLEDQIADAAAAASATPQAPTTPTESDPA